MVCEGQIFVSECIVGSSGTVINIGGWLHSESASKRAELRPACCLTTTAPSCQCKMAILVSEDLGFYLEFCYKLHSSGKLSEFHSKIIDLRSKKSSHYTANLSEA